MKKMNEPREFNGYIFRLIRKYASKSPALRGYVKEVIDLRRSYKVWDSSESKSGQANMVLKINMLLDALIADAQHKQQGVSNE